MKKLFCLFGVVLIGFQSKGQDIKALDADAIKKYTSSPDTVYIINFWATWCAPCVQELPEFNDLDKRFAGKPVKILMVSLDFKDAYPYKLQGFLKRKKLTPEVAWLSETDPNVFIPKIEEAWEGSIPATLIIRPGTARKFIEGQVTEAQVAGIAENYLRNK